MTYLENQEKHIFVIWPNGMSKQKEIDKVIRKYFRMINFFERSLTGDELLTRLMRIYGLDSDSASNRLKVSGVGPLIIYTVLDNSVEYESLWLHGTGYTRANKLVYKCKHEIRNVLGHAWLAHSSNNTTESKKDIRIMLGKEIGENLYQDDDYFRNDGDVLDFLNDVSNYLVLRPLGGGDIDILSQNTPGELASLLNYSQIRMRFLAPIANKENLTCLDVVHRDMRIYCPIWTARMLDNRIYDKKSNVFWPNDEDGLFAMMQHVALNKKIVKKSSLDYMFDLSVRLGYKNISNTDLENKSNLIYHLTKFLKRNGYTLPIPSDPKMRINFDGYKAINKVISKKLGSLYSPELPFQTNFNILQERVRRLSSFNLRGAILSVGLEHIIKTSLNSVTPIRAVRNVNNVLSGLCLETYILPFTLKVEDIHKKFLLKIYVSDYHPIVSGLEQAFLSCLNITEMNLVTPLAVARDNRVIFVVEDFLDHCFPISAWTQSSRFKSSRDFYISSLTSALPGIECSLVRNRLRHRDIHFGNIIMDELGGCFLIDFKHAGIRDDPVCSQWTLTAGKSSPSTDSLAVDQLLKRLELPDNELHTLVNPELHIFLGEKLSQATGKSGIGFTGKKVTIPQDICRQSLMDAIRLNLVRPEGLGKLNELEKLFLQFEADFHDDLEKIRARTFTIGKACANG